MNELAVRILNEMKAIGTPGNVRRQSHFFKEPVIFLGLMAQDIKQVAKTFNNELKYLQREHVYELAEELMKTGYMEAIAIAAIFVYNIRKKFQRTDFEIFSRWVDAYISNWANCDGFCTHVIGTMVEMYPDTIPQIKKWTASPNRWVRRAAAVTLVLPARHGRLVDTVFEIADMMIQDTDEMVLKGYGWALKEAGKAVPERVYDFVAARRDIMPRVAFRYAIEKLPADMRARAMAL